MKRAIAACAAAVLLFAGCTRPSGTGGNRWTIPGVLRIAEREDPDNLDEELGTETIDFDIAAFWGAVLFRLDDRGELYPELATVEPTQANGGISGDGLKITYHLRRNVTWQDGAPFDANDVIYTWQQMLNQRNNVVSRVGYDVISRIDRIDNHTIAVHLKRRFAPFVNTFFAPANHSNVILPRHLLARYPDINRIEYNRLPIGTGPFRVTAYEPGVRVELTANDAYWRGPPKLRRVEFRFVASDTTMLTMLQSHEIDFYYRASEALAPLVRNIPGTRVVLTPYDRFTDVGFNAASPGLGDVRVRRALAYATDRKTLIAKVMHGMAVEGDTNHASFSWSHANDVATYPYDPRKAASLLAAAGWPPGKLHVNLVSFTGSTTVASTEALLQSQWGKAGVDVSIKNVPSGQLYATAASGGIEQSGKFDAIVENWENGGDPDDSVLLMCDVKPPAGWNVYAFCDADFDAAERTALTSYDRVLRANAYRHTQTILAQQLPFYVLWYQLQIDVVNTDFQHYKPAHAVTPFWNVWEWSI
jgi:peptide/nickel transport system substrate-binding protein